jgi:hypothetical protein
MMMLGMMLVILSSLLQGTPERLLSILYSECTKAPDDVYSMLCEHKVRHVCICAELVCACARNAVTWMDKQRYMYCTYMHLGLYNLKRHALDIHPALEQLGGHLHGCMGCMHACSMCS